MAEQKRVAFYGEILPGHALADVKQCLAALLKLSPEQVEMAFSGRRAVLRKGLSAEEGARYVARLEALGLRCVVEAMPAPELASVPVAAALPPMPAPVAVPVEETICPKCGERQPPRTLCRSCAVDMKRFAAAQEDSVRQQAQARKEAREAALIERRQADRMGTGIFGLGFAGRIGRINYLASNLPVLAILLLSVWLTLQSRQWQFLLVGGLLTSFMALRLTALRCHDRSLTGWFALILMIPYVGLVFWLLLCLLPGSEDANEYGPPARTIGVPQFVLFLILCAVPAAMLSRQADLQSLMALYTEAGSMTASGGGEHSPTLAVAEADVEIFTTSTCGVCKVAKAYMDQRGISYAEKNVETSEAYLREFYARGGRGVPYIFVGTQSMSGFDPGELERMLGNAT